MLHVNNLVGFGAEGGGGPASKVYNGYADIGRTSASSFTDASRSIGTASSTRRVAVCIITGASTAAINSVTVGGVSCTLVVTATASDSKKAHIYLSDVVSSGTTADIVVTMASATTGVTIWSYSIYDLNSATAVATITDTATAYSQSLSVEKDGIAIGVFCVNSFSGNITWTGLTEDNDQGVLDDTKIGSVASLTVTSTSSLTVAASHSTTTANVLVAASWR